MQQSFWSLWYFNLPNFVLAVVMYTMLGRALLASNQRAEARKELVAAIAILSEKAAWLPELAELKRLR
mgnify:CR=1 FL=1